MDDGLLLLVPGTESTAEVTFSGLKPLLTRDFDVSLFDFHSDGTKAPVERFTDYVDQLSEVIRACRDRPVHLLGYSLGAHIALATAARNMDNIKSLCLVAGWLRTDSLQRERHDLWLSLYDTDPDLAGRLSHLVQYSPTYRNFLAEQQTVAPLTHAIPNEEIRRRVEVNRVLNGTDAARNIDIPTLIISGTSDFKVPTGSTFELYGSLSQASLVQTTSGHAVLRERLGQVYGNYYDFLKGKLPPGEVVNTLIP